MTREFVKFNIVKSYNKDGSLKATLHTLEDISEERILNFANDNLAENYMLEQGYRFTKNKGLKF